MSEQEYISIDFNFNNKKPSFGDLFKIVGFDNPNFPSTDDTFLKFEDLKIEQIDDYFGIMNEEEVGNDVVLWIYPLVRREEVFHHNGPFDGLRLHFNVLTNSIDKVDMVERVFNQFKGHLDITIFFGNKPIDSFSVVKQNIELKVMNSKTKAL